MKKLYTETEAGEYLSKTKWGIRELRYKGLLPYIKMDRFIYIDKADLDDLIERSKFILDADTGAERLYTSTSKRDSQHDRKQ